MLHCWGGAVALYPWASLWSSRIWLTVSMGLNNKVRVRSSAAAQPPFTCYGRRRIFFKKSLPCKVKKGYFWIKIKENQIFQIVLHGWKVIHLKPHSNRSFFCPFNLAQTCLVVNRNMVEQQCIRGKIQRNTQTHWSHPLSCIWKLLREKWLLPAFAGNIFQPVEAFFGELARIQERSGLAAVFTSI